MIEQPLIDYSMQNPKKRRGLLGRKKEKGKKMERLD